MTDPDSNPFADPDPFGDSSVRNASGGNTKAAGLDDYNPFAQQPTATAPPPPQPAAVLPPAAPAVVPAPYEAPPPYQPVAAQQVDTTELQRRQEELERKAAELQEREQRLRERTIHGAKDNNFPPLPAACCVKPCFYQDIDLEIPPEFSRMVKIAYYTWIVRSIIYLLNFVFAIGYIIAVGSTLTVGTTVGLSILWVILFIILSFLCWYRPVYKAFRSDSSINFFTFFVVSAAQIIVDIVILLGPNGSGFLGLLTAIPLMNSGDKPSINMGGVMFILIILAIPVLMADIFLLVRVHNMYRSTGASFQKAQSEFATGVMKNEGVRTAAADAAAGAAAGAMSSAAGGSSGNKY